ncbi:MAG: [FeFe] hydrogenase H-cluster maturation GTPase HydF [Ruminococcaceae bacterium]|nr:[FeFe] hydrogenase H-cluster maturation GTPase HydF [Oscillospiraceae bacterium]
MANLNETASAQRIHISFFGLRNAGKSSVVNAVTSQQLSVVSEVKGTTTDPVKKAMELLPLGPVVIIDTPGIDDEGELGALRVKKAKEILAKTDVAVLVTDVTRGMTDTDRELISSFEDRNIPYIIAFNKCDLACAPETAVENSVAVSAKTGEGINDLKLRIASLGKQTEKEKYIIADLTDDGDTVILVIPIDASAPKGRIILPQQQVLRELLDFHRNIICCQPEELPSVIEGLKNKPRLTVTDSQAFPFVAKVTPSEIKLTSFSILFARYKGSLEELVRGAKALSELKDGDRVLISEGCTHHRQCEDIGTVKMPRMISEYSHADLKFDFTSGGDYPDNLSEYKINVHCGGCMLNEREMQNRIRLSLRNSVPIVNYGVAIAQMNGILKRSLEPFPEILKILD